MQLVGVDQQKMQVRSPLGHTHARLARLLGAASSLATTHTSLWRPRRRKGGSYPASREEVEGSGKVLVDKLTAAATKSS